MKSPTPEAQSAEDAFQMLYPICAVNFTNNVEVKLMMAQPLKILNN